MDGCSSFFVLSGYLITNILLNERSKTFPTYVSTFYWRRSLRIFPLYFTFLGIAGGLFVLTGFPEEFAWDWPFLASYTANLARLRETDIGPHFVHLWSLAVEEQFYLVWPPLVYFCSQAALKRIVICAIALSPLMRFGLNLAFLGQDADWIGRNIYCLPFSQFDAFATGAAIAIWKPDTWLSGRLLFVPIALVVLGGISVLASEHILYRSAIKWSFGYSMFLLPAYGFVWGYSFLNFASASLIVAALQKRPLLKWLEASLLTYIGRISYGIYVYHLPVMLVLRNYGLTGVPLLLSCASWALVISSISFKVLEMPFLRLKDVYKQRG